MICVPEQKCTGIAGLSLAAKTIYDNLDKKVEKMRMLKQHFIEGVEKD